MTRGLSEAEIAALVEGQIATDRAVRELAHTIAAERGITLSNPQPEPNQQRTKARSYRLTNLTRGADGGIAADVEYGDGSKRRFRVARNEDGDLEGELEDVADAETAQETDAEPAPSSSTHGPFEDIFGSVDT